MVTKRRELLKYCKDSSALAKIFMVTKLSINASLGRICSVLAKIHMVTKRLFVAHDLDKCSVLAKIHMEQNNQWNWFHGWMVLF